MAIKDGNDAANFTPKSKTPPPQNKPENPVGSASPNGDVAKIALLKGEDKMTLSSPVKELEELKTSFKTMMVALSNFIESAGLEMGKNEEIEKMNLLVVQMQQMQAEFHAEENKLREDLKTFKDELSEKQAKDSEQYVRLKEFQRFRDAVRAAI